MNTRKLDFLCYLLLFALLIAPIAKADTTVTGIGNPVLDIPAVQGAVDLGGVVTLQGNFDFGTSGLIEINNDVEIIGENATIYNGRGFLINAPEFDVTIRGSDESNRLTFVEPNFAAIIVRGCESLTVMNVKVDGVVGFLTPLGEIQKYGIFAECWLWWDGLGPLTPLLISRLSIVDCNIDLGDYLDDTVHAKGIAIFGVGTPDNEVDIQIKGNTVMNCSRHGMGLHDFAGKLTVNNNIIRPGNKAVNYMGTGANGIWTNQTPFPFDLPGGVGFYQPDWVWVTIKNNDITCEPNIFENGARAVGIIAFNQQGTVIKNNEISVDNGYDCIDIFDGGDGFTVKGNICSGSDSYWGIHLAGNATNFKIKKNDLSTATPLYAQISIESSGNNNSVKHNDFGPGGDSGGIYCNGYNNKFFNNTFHGDYPGWPGSGFVFLDVESHDNHVVALKKATPPHGFDICDQVWDDGTDNKISGYKKCSH